MTLYETRQAQFYTTLRDKLRAAFETDPRYSVARAKTTPEALAERFTHEITIGESVIIGDAIKATCKDLGIKPSNRALTQYVNAQ